MTAVDVVAMQWTAAQVAAVEAVLESSLQGRPTTLVMMGKAGMGKSSLLDEVCARADGFTVLRTDCLPFSEPAAFTAVEQLGVDTEQPSGSGALAVPMAAQRMRRLLDQRLATGPIAVIVDDLQWADPESVEVLLSVIGRTEAEHLAFVVASRPLDPARHPLFQRWLGHAPGVHKVVLDGLDQSAAARLLREIRPAMDPAVIESIWGHTEGNPLYLRSLALDYDETQLARMRVFPAPAEFATTVTNRLSRLSPAAVSLARAVAVLGEDWYPLPDAAAVAELDEVATAVDELADAQLVRLRNADMETQIRLAHGLVRSAVYQDIRLEERRTLHRRAATVVTSIALVFEHRIAATLSYDDALADDLERYAAQLRARQEFGSAARFLRFASRVTEDPVFREQRWLDSLADSSTDVDYGLIRSERAAVEQAQDRRRADLVLGLLATVGDWRPQDGARLLEPWSGADHTDLTQYRIEGMLAWARMASDADDEQIGMALDRASALRAADSGVGRRVMLTWAQLTARHSPDLLAIPPLASLPADPKLAPAAADGVLAWRGTIRTGLGHFDAAIGDLIEVTDRIQRGAVGSHAGWYYAVLGRAQWFRGDWARSRLSFRAALEMSEGSRHPIVAAALPMQAIGEGDLDQAAKQIAEAHEVLDRVPWREAVDQLVIVEIARAHAEDQAPAGLLAQLGPYVPDLLGRAPTKSVMWLTHVALAAVWAGELATAGTLVELMESKPQAAAWTRGFADWIRGLIAEANGDARAAVTHLAAAVAVDLSAVPLYRAHVLVDHARLVHLARGAQAAQAALSTAAAIYRTVDARAYLLKLDRLQDMPGGSGSGSGSGPRIELSERERDVLTLVVAGMSYAQIARDLFITQRTVGFHLGNIYAKSNVKNRHQLIDLARTQPVVFGLPDASHARA